MVRLEQTNSNNHPPAETHRRNILIVKLGAFGNIVLSMGAFRAIRGHHAGARISVLTSAAYADWLRTFPYFDDVLVDPHPAWWDLAAARRLGRMLADGGFDRVYDLQTSKRSSWYFRLFPAKRRPEWSGIAFGCSLPDRDPQRNVLHDAARQQGQLRQAGMTDFPPPDLSWMRGDIGRFGRTSFGDIAELARAARFAVGNDTGPMHLIATAGCPSITLFSRDSDPSHCAPVGRWTRELRRPDLADLTVETVLESLPEPVGA
jgi:ADP-heptose:LPS heptosyltransferase